MGDIQEKDTDKNLDTQKIENPKDMSIDDKDSKSKPTSDNPDVSEIEKLKNDLKAQANYTSEIQKKLNESQKVIEAFKNAFSKEDEKVTDVVTPEAVKTQLDSLMQEIAKKDAELAKNTYIDSLDGISEAQRRYLKNHVQATDNLEDSVKKNLDDLRQVIESEIPRAIDNRPKGAGSSSFSVTDARSILEHPENYKG